MRNLRAYWISVIILALAMLIPSSLVLAPQSLSPSLESLGQENLGASQSILYQNHSQSIITGANPSLIATGDFNNDTKLDIAVGCTLDKRIEIFFTQPDGSFPSNPNRTIELGYAPTGLATLDFNNDSLDDLVVTIASEGSRGLAEVYCQTNQSNYVLSFLDTPDQRPYGVVTGDFDNDGIDDFTLICDSDSGSVCVVMTYSSKNNFLPCRFYPYGGSSLYEKQAKIIAKTDFNLDKRLDLVVASQYWGNFTTFRNNGVFDTVSTPFTFTQTVIVNSPTYLEASQIDGAAADEICAVSNQNQVRVYRATDGIYSLSGSITDLSGITSLSLLQFDGNNLADILVTNSSSSRVEVYITSRVAGEFTYGPRPSQWFPCHANPVASSRFGQDLLVACNAATNGSVTIFRNSSTPLSNADSNLKSIGGPSDFRVADFNNDGRPEIAAIIPSSNLVRFYDPAGNVIASKATGTTPSSIASGKLGGAYWDAAISNSVSNDVYFYWGGANLASSTPLIIPSNISSPKMVCAGVLTNSSYADCVILGDNGFEILRNLGTDPYFSQDSSLTIPASGGLSFISIGSFNAGITGDQLNDIAVANNTDHSVWIFRQNPSSPAFSSSNIYRLNDLPFSNAITWMSVGRFNQDNLDDLLVCLADGTAVLYLQKSSHRLDSDDGSTHNIGLKAAGGAVSDYDDDGIDEIALISNAPANGIVYDPIDRVAFYSFSGGAGACRLASGDLNVDGRSDLVFSSQGSSSVSIIYQRDLPPHAKAQCLTASPIEGSPVQFTSRDSFDSFSDNSSLQFTWEFGDGITNSTNSLYINHTYVNNGTYQVNLTVSDREGLNDSTSITNFYVKETVPIASFSVGSGKHYEGDEVQFTDTSSAQYDPIINRIWDFGDGTVLSTNQKTVNNTYLWNANFTVKLTVIDNDQNASTYSTQVNVLDRSPSIESVTVKPSSPMEGAPVNFNASWSSYPDRIISWNWDFGVGSGAGRFQNFTDHGNTTFTFPHNGTYHVVLRVYDNDSDYTSFGVDVTVQDSMPSASFRYLPAQPLEGQEVSFIDQSEVYDWKGAVWHWDFGDGSKYDGNSSIVHTYARNGTYRVTLTVVDGDGDTNSTSQWIEIHDVRPKASFTVETSPLLESSPVRFIDTSIGNGNYSRIVKWIWSFGDGNYSQDQNPSHTYDNQGNYMVGLRVQDSHGNWSNEFFLNITVSDTSPLANEISPESGSVFNESQSIVFSIRAKPTNDNIIGYEWLFYDGNSSTVPFKQTHTIYPYLNDSLSHANWYRIEVQVWDKDSYSSNFTIVHIVTGRAPDVYDVTIITSATAGDNIEITAKVNDSSGLSVHVTLYYTFGNGIKSQPMTLISGNTYLGRIGIPAGSSMLSYWVNATNEISSAQGTTQEYTVTITERPNLFIYLIPLIVGALIIGFFYRREAMVVDDVFLIYDDGNLIAHQTRRLKPGMDDDILGSMLVALQNFVKDSFKDESSIALNRMDFGEKKVLIERGEKVYLAVVLHGKREANIPQKMKGVIEAIEKEYGPILSQWDGDYEKVRGIKDKTQSIFKVSPFNGRKAKAD